MPILYESYAKSGEAVVTGQKKPTKMFMFLFDEAGIIRQEGKTLYVGTKILIRTALMREPWNTSLDRKIHRIYHRLNTGAWTKIADKTATYNFIEHLFTIEKAGTHSFYAEFPGDAVYEGCKKAAKTFAR